MVPLLRSACHRHSRRQHQIFSCRRSPRLRRLSQLRSSENRQGSRVKQNCFWHHLPLPTENRQLHNSKVQSAAVVPQSTPLSCDSAAFAAQHRSSPRRTVISPHPFEVRSVSQKHPTKLEEIARFLIVPCMQKQQFDCSECKCHNLSALVLGSVFLIQENGRLFGHSGEAMMWWMLHAQTVPPTQKRLFALRHN